MPEIGFLGPSVSGGGGGDTSLLGMWEEWGSVLILTFSPHMPQAEEEDEKGTAGGLLSSLEGPKMRPSLLMTRYLESWGAAKPFAHLSHVESPVSTSTPLPVRAHPS